MSNKIRDQSLHKISGVASPVTTQDQWRRQPKKSGGSKQFFLASEHQKVTIYMHGTPPPPPIYKTLFNGFAQISGGV